MIESHPVQRSKRWPLRVLRGGAALLFILAGLNHFRVPQLYASIVPPHFADPPLLVAISGIAEIVGGIGLIIPMLRFAAAYGLIALLIAVFPANVWMVISPRRLGEFNIAPWLLWARLPLQAVAIAWVYCIR